MNAPTIKIEYTGYVPEKEWPHYSWRVTIGTEAFNYRTGIGHATKITGNRKPIRRTVCDSAHGAWIHVPDADEVLACLFDDARSGSESFKDFCDNCGYSDDSLKALDTYRACMDTAARLRRALGTAYAGECARIDALREEGKL